MGGWRVWGFEGLLGAVLASKQASFAGSGLCSRVVAFIKEDSLSAPMICLRCKKRDAAIELPHAGALCNACFLETIEQRVRKDLSKNCPLTRGEKVCLLTNETKESAVSKWMMERLSSKLNLVVEQRPLATPGVVSGFTKVFSPFDADDVGSRFLEGIFKGEPQHPTLSLLQGVLDSEVKLFADLRKLPYQAMPEHPSTKALRELEGFYPGSIFGLVKTQKQLEK